MVEGVTILRIKKNLSWFSRKTSLKDVKSLKPPLLLSCVQIQCPGKSSLLQICVFKNVIVVQTFVENDDDLHCVRLHA